MRIIACIAVAAILILSGCSEKTANINGYSEKAENILDAFNDNNYAAFSRDFSANMLQAFPEDQFEKVRKFVHETSGQYISKYIALTKEEQGIIIVGYSCRFSGEEVLFTVSFSRADGKVEGIYFDSTGMREAMGAAQ